MSSVKSLPTSGYLIESLFYPDQRLEQATPTDGDGELGFGWNWRALDKTTFEVVTRVVVNPTAERPERISVTVVGRFRQIEGEPSVARNTFVSLHAPAILLPFARQLIATLSGGSMFGPIFLPAINVELLMKDYDKSTAIGDRILHGEPRMIVREPPAVYETGTHKGSRIVTNSMPSRANVTTKKSSAPARKK